MKIILNRCYGGFELSEKALKMLNIEHQWDYEGDIRTSPEVIEIVEKLGKEASGRFANLMVINIPEESTDYIISDYDGVETLYYVIDGKIKQY